MPTWERRLTALYADEHLWAEFSRRGRENVRNHSSIEAVGRMIEDLLAFAEEPPRRCESIPSFPGRLALASRRSMNQSIREIARH